VLGLGYNSQGAATGRLRLKTRTDKGRYNSPWHLFGPLLCLGEKLSTKRNRGNFAKGIAQCENCTTSSAVASDGINGEFKNENRFIHRSGLKQQRTRSGDISSIQFLTKVYRLTGLHLGKTRQRTPVSSERRSVYLYNKRISMTYNFPLLYRENSV
jgi:hypothetical protein